MRGARHIELIRCRMQRSSTILGFMIRTVYTLIIAISICLPAARAQEAGIGTATPSPPEADTASPSAKEIRLNALEALATVIPDEYRNLGKGDETAEIFVQVSRDGNANGILLLVPPDGLKPTSAPGIEPLRRALPDAGWETWLLSLERERTVTSRYLASDADAQPPAAPATDGVEPNPSSDADGVEPATAVVTLDEAANQQANAWLEQAASTIAFTAGEARSASGKLVVIVGEGRASAAVLAALREDPELADAVILIDAARHLGAADTWPSSLTAPVLEILTSRQRRDFGVRQQQMAKTASLTAYEQAVLEYEDAVGRSAQAPAVRRIRGWLKRLSDRTAPQR